ncbi:hypothetical protein B0T17DRAFT_515328 [Bombardia bombarda]|uniref:Uncharacterized protein n=1 Tax=Bombardia bombarda TaxID=252184 RepID=A0AA39XK12_9PEZI|nr:hypothetical protein B0T17DRAFT_515328 [Bombardia bombarda]
MMHCFSRPSISISSIIIVITCFSFSPPHSLLSKWCVCMLYLHDIVFLEGFHASSYFFVPLTSDTHAHTQWNKNHHHHHQKKVRCKSAAGCVRASVHSGSASDA